MASVRTLLGAKLPMLAKVSGVLLCGAVILGSLQPAQAQTQEPTDYRPLTQESSILSIQGGNRLMQEATVAISSQNYPVAQKKLQDARQVFNQLSNFYQELASTLWVSIPKSPKVNEIERSKQPNYEMKPLFNWH